MNARDTITISDNIYLDIVQELKVIKKENKIRARGDYVMDNFNLGSY